MTEIIHDQKLVIEHTKMLTEIDSRSRSNTKRLDNIDKLVDVVQGMNINVAVIAEQTKQQGEELRILVKTLKTHEEKIDIIEDKMETKDTVARLHERVDELEMKDGKNAEKMLKQIRWLLISLSVTAVFYLMWGKFI